MGKSVIPSRRQAEKAAENHSLYLIGTCKQYK